MTTLITTLLRPFLFVAGIFAILLLLLSLFVHHIASGKPAHTFFRIP